MNSGTGYKINGNVTNEFPAHIDDLKTAEPIYETLPGWKDDLTTVRNEADLPTNAIKYIDRIGTSRSTCNYCFGRTRSRANHFSQWN